MNLYTYSLLRIKVVNSHVLRPSPIRIPHFSLEKLEVVSSSYPYTQSKVLLSLSYY